MRIIALLFLCVATLGAGDVIEQVFTAGSATTRTTAGDFDAIDIVKGGRIPSTFSVYVSAATGASACTYTVKMCPFTDASCGTNDWVSIHSGTRSCMPTSAEKPLIALGHNFRSLRVTIDSIADAAVSGKYTANIEK